MLSDILLAIFFAIGVIALIVYEWLFVYRCKLVLTFEGKNEEIAIYSDEFQITTNDVEHRFKRVNQKWTVDEQPIEKGVSFKIDEYDAVIKDNEKTAIYRKKATHIISVVIMLPLFLNVLISVLVADVKNGDGPFDIITAHADKKPETEENNNDSPLTDEKDKLNLILSVESKDVQLVACSTEPTTLSISRNVVWTDNKKHSYNAEELVDQTICTFFEGENGEKCYFIGQYNDAYHWNGACTICSYLDGKLYYVTDDVYEDGTIVSYKRVSKNGNQWIYTDKTVDKNENTFGDTWSYDYQDIPEKEHSTELPTKDDLYSVADVRTAVNGLLNSHYRGAYNRNQDWCDLSGEAYVIKYRNSEVAEVYKGTVVDCNYIDGICIKKSDEEDFIVITGRFHDFLDGPANTVSNRQTYDEVCSLIEGEEFEAEIKKAGWYGEQYKIL